MPTRNISDIAVGVPSPLIAHLTEGIRTPLINLALEMALLLFVGSALAVLVVSGPLAIGRFVRVGMGRLRERRLGKPTVRGEGPGAVLLKALYRNGNGNGKARAERIETARQQRRRAFFRNLRGGAWAVLRFFLHEGVFVFAVALTLNLVVGYWLVFYQHFLPGDAIARVADAYYVLFSRDPHLAAIGFIWPPLPSFIELPIVAFKSMWPELVTMGYAGSIQTALFGAGSAVVLNKLLRHYGLRAPLRHLFLAAYMLNPMVLVYNSNGMSEAAFIFFLLSASYLFLTWTESGRTARLVGLAFVISIGLFVRYELWLFAILIGAGVVLWTFRRRLSQYRQTEARVLLYALPVLYAALLWLGMNAVIMRDPLFFIHGYNPAGSTSAAHGAFFPTMSWGAAAQVVLDRVLNLYPVYFLGVAAVVLAAALTRRWRPALTLIVASSSALLMQELLIHQGNSFLDLRYFMTAIPFAFVFAAFALGLIKQWWVRLPLVLPALAILLAGNVYSALTMHDPHYYTEPFLVTAAVNHTSAPGGGLVAWRDIADQIEAAPGNQLVVLDTVTGFAIYLSSPNPKRYVVTSDRDFEASVAEPYRHNVRYFVVPPPSGRGALDRVNQLYPEMWANGAGIATLQQELPAGYRLYRLTWTAAKP